MVRTALVLALSTAFGAPAFAQVIETPTSTTVVVPPGAPGVVVPLPNATGDAGAVVYSPTGRPEDKIVTDSAAGGNEAQPSRLGSGGGGGSGR